MSMGSQDSPKKSDESDDNQAVDLIRQKIDTLYSDEPDASQESNEAEAAGAHRSKHQEFMHNLTNSAKSLAEIQTEWHNYYIALPDQEKIEVWQEFYTEHSKATETKKAKNKTDMPKPKSTGVRLTHKLPDKPKVVKVDNRTAKELKNNILKKAVRKTTKNQNFKSLLFGLSVGGVFVIILLFGFFNERFIAPFFSPSKNVSNTPIVIDPATTAVGSEPKIIIPKINVEIPVVYDEPSVKEEDIQDALEKGVVHYSTTPLPGETGNGVIFGHSSNNILNKGKYKFAFVLLKQLEVGDTFYLDKDGKRYVYKIDSKNVVKPSDVSILTTRTEKSTITLVTCDPPGTSLNRLLVTGEQISPDPSTNVASTAKQSDEQVAQIPSNAPSLWHRITSIF